MALTFSELRAANESRCAQWHGLSDWSVMEWACAMAGEAGEACNVAKKIKRIETGIAKNPAEIGVDLVPDLAEECADVMLYLDLLCASRGIDLASAVVAKFNAVSERYDFPQHLIASATEQIVGDRLKAMADAGLQAPRHPDDRSGFQSDKASATEQASGWRLVPVEPTVEMVRAALQNDTFVGRRDPVSEYRSMLAAAPPHSHGEST